MRKLDTNKSIIEYIQNEGRNSYPNEACGVIVKDGRKSVPYTCNNIAGDPKESFLIDPRDYARISADNEVIGIWHTHTDKTNNPSIADRAGCENTELPWLIMDVSNKDGNLECSDLNCITPNGTILPYIGRPYAFGVLDCFSLMRDWYKKELGIAIPDCFRVEEWWKKGLNTMDEYWQENGFIDVTGETPKRGDCFLFKMGSNVPNHVAIYIGDDTMLHHLYGRLSTVDTYGGYYYKHTFRMIRHKETL